MKPKNRSFRMPETKMTVGLHRLKINSIKYARKSNNEILINVTGDVYIDIIFINHIGQDLIYRCSMGNSTLWILDNLRKALKVYKEDQQTDISEMIGKKCYGIVAAEFMFEIDDEGENVLSRDIAGHPIYSKKLQPKFYAISESGPAKKGDPVLSQGIPGEDFLINPGLILEDWITDDDRGWFIMEMGGVNAGIKKPRYSDVSKRLKETVFEVEPLNDEF